MTMYQTLGQTLADPQNFYRRIRNALTALTVLHTVTRAGLFAQIGDEPVTVDALSTSSGIPADKLQRLLYFLAAEEIVTLLPDGRIAATAAAHSVQEMEALLVSLTHGFEAGVPLLEALQTGRTSYELRFGAPVFQYLSTNPQMSGYFAGFMAYMSRVTENFVFSEFTFAPFMVAADIGGSHGTLLLKLLEVHPGTTGVLFDLPEVSAMVADSVARAPQGERVSIVSGDFFEAVPAADLYLLKMILHDWGDAECVTLLKNLRAAMQPGARIIVIDLVMPETPRADFLNGFDIAMLVWTNGKERKLSEFVALFAAAGLRLNRVVENLAGPSVVEAVAV
jgi:hypothetical protein